MNNKGFTLVELIAILLVLVIIFTISFPTLQNIGKNDLEKEYSQMVENLCKAGESYISAHADSFEELGTFDATIRIDIQTLIEYGSVNEDLKNPRTKNTLTNDYLLFTVLGDDSLACEYKDV